MAGICGVAHTACGEGHGQPHSVENSGATRASTAGELENPGALEPAVVPKCYAPAGSARVRKGPPPTPAPCRGNCCPRKGCARKDRPGPSARAHVSRETLRADACTFEHLLAQASTRGLTLLECARLNPDSQLTHSIHGPCQDIRCTALCGDLRASHAQMTYHPRTSPLGR